MERWRKCKSDRPPQNSCGTIISLSKSPKINLYNSQRDLPLSIPTLKKAISFLLQELKISTDEIIIHFVSEIKIKRIHKTFFNDPTSTDCITFPIDSHQEKRDSYHVLGEAFICPKIAIECSKRYRIAPLEELYRYIVHCVLHLIGYEDTQAADRARMKRKERLCLKKMIRYKTASGYK